MSIRGLPNLGNTCYLNSVIQILMHTPRFCELVKEYYRETENTHPLIRAFVDLQHNYFSENNIEPSLRTFICEFIKYKEIFGSGHQDQHEYLMLLHNIIHDNINAQGKFRLTGKVRSAIDKLEHISLEEYRTQAMSTTDDPRGTYNSPVYKLFTGQCHCRTQCPKCNYVSSKFETFKSWEVPIGNHDKPSVELRQCLDEFTAIEKLAEKEEYECDRCKEKQRCLRKCDLWRLPEILVICVKRNTGYNKDTRAVEAPLVLDVAPYLSVHRDRTIYSLYGIANHMGSPIFGHCTCHILRGDQWYYVNDEHITPISRVEDTKTNYIFFYARN